MRHFAILVLFVISGSLFAEGIVPPITTEDISIAFDYPVDRLRAIDKTTEIASRYGPAIKSATLFQPDDKGFSQIQVLVTKGGFLLGATLKEKFEANGENVQKVKMVDGSVGYVGTEGAGPGGEGHIGIAHLAEQNLDVQFKVIISNKSPVSDDPMSEKYHASLRDETVLRRILSAMLLTAGRALSNGKDASSAVDHEELIVDSAPPRSSVIPRAVVNGHKSGQPEDNPKQGKRTDVFQWWGSLLILLSAVVVAWLKFRKRA